MIASAINFKYQIELPGTLLKIQFITEIKTVLSNDWLI